MKNTNIHTTAPLPGTIPHAPYMQHQQQTTASYTTAALSREATSTHQNPYIVSYEANNDFCPPHNFQQRGNKVICIKKGCGLEL